MNEQEQISQLSALFDGELPPEQADLVIRRALKDPGTRVRWDRYALIGACLRNEPLAASGRPDVADRVSARLASEPDFDSGEAPAAAAPTVPGRVRYGLFGRGALGGAIAASVALVSIFLMRSPAVGDAGVQIAGTQGPAVQAVDQDVAPSYTTPINTSPTAVRVDRSLASYLMAHGEVASSSYRISSLSAAMYEGYDPTIGAVEMTEAEIGAYR